jgi:hypothetical protein
VGREWAPPPPPSPVVVSSVLHIPKANYTAHADRSDMVLRKTERRKKKKYPQRYGHAIGWRGAVRRW